MINLFDSIRIHKCLNCVHVDLCLENRGGADLDIAVADCRHFKDSKGVIELPKKFWILFDVPGFYNIVEYDVDRVSYADGKLDRLWGHHGSNKDTEFRKDFGTLVFFSEADAKTGLENLIKERANE